jgi:hypothetical protein
MFWLYRLRVSTGPTGAGWLEALAFLERAHESCRTFAVETGDREIRVGASQYLIRYLFIDVQRAA